MSFAVIAALAVFIAILFGLYRFQQRSETLSRTVLLGLVAGSLFGLALQFVFSGDLITKQTVLDWVAIVGSGYVNLLKMVIMPLVLVSMIAAVVKLDNQGSLGKISFVTIAILVFTTAIAALIGIFITQAFGLSAEGLVEGARETARIAVLEERATAVADLTIPQMLLSFVPTNPFADLTGERSTSIIAVVIFGVLTGIAARRAILEESDLSSPIKMQLKAHRQLC